MQQFNCKTYNHYMRLGEASPRYTAKVKSAIPMGYLKTVLSGVRRPV